MSFLVDLLAGGWAKLAGILGVVAALAAGWFQIRRSGEDRQAAKDATAGLTEARNANQARGAVGSDADVERLLKPPGGR